MRNGPLASQPHHRLRALHDACKCIGVLDDESAIVIEALASARRAFDADQAILLLRERDTGPMKPFVDPIAARSLPALDIGGVDTTCIVAHGRAMTVAEITTSHAGGVLDFTVLGNTVDLASRVESATMTLGRTIVLTERTRRLLGDDARCEDLGVHPIHGFTVSQRLFALQAVAAASTAAALEGGRSPVDGTALA